MTSIMNKNINLPWIEKYRPNNTNKILLEPFLLEKINKIIMSKSIPNMILTGEPGTGKTSTVLIIAKEIFKDDYADNVLELNASDDRGLSIINNAIIPFCQKITKSTEKLIILDEADSITNKAQNLLSNLINLFKKNCRFVFVCNDSVKINESIQSKCIIVNFPKLTDTNIYDKLVEICNNEKIEYTKEFIDELIFISDKDIRKSINNLECIYFTHKKLTIDNIYKLLDKPKPEYIRNIIHMCVENKFEESILEVTKLYKNGYNVSDILLTFLNYLMKSNNNLNIPQEKILELFKIISFSYSNVQEGNDSLVQLVGCISNIFLNNNSNTI
jgi:replication factor C subunit 2/4